MSGGNGGAAVQAAAVGRLSATAARIGKRYVGPGLFDLEGGQRTDNLLREICPHAGLNYFGIDEELFHQNKAVRPLDVGSVFVERGYCYGGFRCFPRYPVPLLDSAKRVLLVRDPRDMLVSLYFSIRESHVAPEGEGDIARVLKTQRELARATPINEWVKENYYQVLLGLEGYFAQGFMRRSNVAIYRYEDVIFRKLEWLTELAAWYRWHVPPEVTKDVAARHDLVPNAERLGEHIAKCVQATTRPI